MYSEKRTNYIPRVFALQYHFSLHFSLIWLLAVYSFQETFRCRIALRGYNHPQSGSLPPQRVIQGGTLLWTRQEFPIPSAPSPIPIPHHHLAPQLTQSTPRYSFLVPCAAYGRVKGEDLQERASGFRCFEKAEGAYRLELKRNSPSTGCSTGRDDCIAGLTFDRRIAWMEMRRVERGCAWMVWCAIGWVWLASGDAGWSDMGWRVVG